MVNNRLVEDRQTIEAMLQELAIFASHDKERQNKESFEVSIFPSNLETYNISAERCGQILYLLEKEGKLITKNRFDEDDILAEQAKGNDQSCFDIVLPLNFISINQTAGKTKKASFDVMNQILNYGNDRHSFQKERLHVKNKRFFIFKTLWENRRHRHGNKVVEGKRLPYGFLAVQGGVSDSVGVFERSQKHKEELKNIIKGINKDFKDKDIPLKIESGNGAQLIDNS